MIIRVSKLRCMQWITRMNDRCCNNLVHLMRRRHHTHSHTLTPFCTLAALLFNNHPHCAGTKAHDTQKRNVSWCFWVAHRSNREVCINKAEPVCARPSRHQNARHRRALYTQRCSVRERTVSGRRDERNRRERRVKAIMQVAGKNGSYQKDESRVARSS